MLGKWEKTYELWIQKAIRPTGFSNGRVTYDPGDYIIIRPPITIEFSINRQAYASSNQANIKVYNLSPKTRSEVFRDRNSFYNPNPNVAISENNQPRDVMLFAGYASEGGQSLMFKGQMFYGHTQRRGTDFITELECQDPAIYQYAAMSNVSIPKTELAAKKKSDMILQFVKDMYGGVPPKAIISPSVQAADYANTANAKRGIARKKSAMDLAKEAMTDSNGHKCFFIDNGTPVAIGFGEAYVNPALTIITPETGLLNIPMKSEYIVAAQLMMEPRLLVGQALRVDGYQDSEYNGDYKVVGVQHNGMISGTHDSPTTTTASLFNGQIIKSFTVQ